MLGQYTYCSCSGYHIFADVHLLAQVARRGLPSFLAMVGNSKKSETREEHIPRKDEVRMERQQDEQTLSELPSYIITMMTTEHYNLQSGRSMTVSDVNGRAALFIGAVSTTLIALAFIGQVSQLGTAFFVFSLVLFPSLIFMGLVSFERVLQSGIEDIMYARGMNRIRHFYLEHAPQMQPYFVLSTHDDQGVPFNLGGT